MAENIAAINLAPGLKADRKLEKRAGGCAAHHRRGDEGCAKELGSSRACAHGGI